MEETPVAAPPKIGPEAKLSMWTVVGAVAASVLTASVLGAASGIMQVPGMLNELTEMRATRTNTAVQIASLSERIRSAELVGDSVQRQINDIAARQNAVITRADKQDAEFRQLAIDSQKGLVGLDSMNERVKALFGAISSLRQNLYDLATRGYKQPASELPQFPQLQKLPPPAPPSASIVPGLRQAELGRNG